MKKPHLPALARVLVCLLGVGLALYGSFALVSLYLPDHDPDGGQPALTPSETVAHGLVALTYALVFLLPPRLFVQRPAYWLALSLRLVSVLFILYIPVAGDWSDVSILDLLIIVFMLLTTSLSVWELPDEPDPAPHA